MKSRPTLGSVVEPVHPLLRVILPQAVEYAQSDAAELLESFTRALKQHDQRVVALQERTIKLLRRISRLEIDHTHGVRDFVFASSQVRELLCTSRRVRQLKALVDPVGPQLDRAIDIARKSDGSLIVLPTLTA